MHHAVKTCEYEDVHSLWEIVKRYDKEMARSSSSCRRRQRWNMVANLRQRFFHSIELGGLAGDRRAVVPASGFSFSAQQIWRIIKENKDLDLPTHKVMVATVRCEEIFNEKYVAFSANEMKLMWWGSWFHLQVGKVLFSYFHSLMYQIDFFSAEMVVLSLFFEKY
nr:protein ROOT HAIR DEFECTIVE 3-like isoform X1 [Ipomoea batatas]